MSGRPFSATPRAREWSEGSARGVFLTGFAPGSRELADEHRRWLRGFAARVASLTGNLYIVGLTDRTATEEDSRALGDARARAVYHFLRRGGHGFPWVDVHVGSTGDHLAGSEAERAARSRAVAVVHVSPGWVPLRWLREMVQSGPQPTSIFYVRSRGLARGGAPSAATEEKEHVAGLRPIVEIGDGRWSVLYRFAVEPEGPRGGGPPQAAGSLVTDAAGPWHTFTSPFDLRVDQFAGSAARLSGPGRSRPEREPGRLALGIVRPPVLIRPFLLDSESSERAVLGCLGGRESGASPGGSTDLVGRLEAAGGDPRQRAIPPAIRAHLRRGGAPGARTSGDAPPRR